MHSVRNTCFIMILHFALMAISACSNMGEVIIDPAALKTPTPLVEKAPVAVGVHYEALLNHYYLHKERAIWGLVEYEYRLGPPSIALFDRHFSSMFETVVRVDSPSTMSVNGQNISAVLSVNIKSFHPHFLSPPIKYAMTLYAPPGVKRTTIEATGESGVDYWVGRSTLAARAMRKAVAAMVVLFYEDPAVKAWLETHGVGRNTGNPTDRNKK